MRIFAQRDITGKLLGRFYQFETHETPTFNRGCEIVRQRPLLGSYPLKIGESCKFTGQTTLTRIK